MMENIDNSTTCSMTIKTEVKYEDCSDFQAGSAIKPEIKQEDHCKEEKPFSTLGMFCPFCGKHFFYERYFSEHIQMDHRNGDPGAGSSVGDGNEGDFAMKLSDNTSQVDVGNTQNSGSSYTHSNSISTSFSEPRSDNQTMGGSTRLPEADVDNMVSYEHEDDSITSPDSESIKQPEHGRPCSTDNEGASSSSKTIGKLKKGDNDKTTYCCADNKSSCWILDHSYSDFRLFALEITDPFFTDRFASGRYLSLCCKRRFNTERQLRKHVRENCRTFQCEKCSNYFKSQFLLKRHDWLQHPKYKCHQCNACFTLKSSLIIHNHEGKCDNMLERNAAERLYQCDMCDLAFQDGVSLSNHINSLHITYYINTCGVCDRSYRRQYRLIYHMKTHCLYKCGQCKRCFGNCMDLSEHIDTAHNVNSLGKSKFDIYSFN